MKFTIINAPAKTSYSIYLQNNPRRYTQNTIVGNTTSVEIPDEMTGPGYATFAVSRTDRLSFVKNYKVNFDLQGDYTCDLSKLDEPKITEQPQSEQLSSSSSSPKTPILQTPQTNSEEKTSVQTTKPAPKAKKLITNKLQEQVQANNVKKLNNLELSNETDSKKNFWDRFK